VGGCRDAPIHDVENDNWLIGPKVLFAKKFDRGIRMEAYSRVQRAFEENGIEFARK
jgi:hypothetical protein